VTSSYRIDEPVVLSTVSNSDGYQMPRKAVNGNCDLKLGSAKACLINIPK
jgi:hypothetical protein